MRQSTDLLEGDILVVVGVEDLEIPERGVTRVLHVVPERRGNEADIAGLVATPHPGTKERAAVSGHCARGNRGSDATRTW